MKLELEIDLAPPSINSFYGNRGHRKYITHKGREFKTYVETSMYHLVKPGGKTVFGDARVKTDYEFHFRGKRKRDTTNYIKPMEDCLSGIIFDDDEQVDEMSAKRFYYAEYNHILITITKLPSKTVDK